LNFNKNVGSFGVGSFSATALSKNKEAVTDFTSSATAKKEWSLLLNKIEIRN
jgi:hypothetical protein